MPQLIVVGFKEDMYRASSVLNQLQTMNYDWAVDLHDAVAAYRDYNGKLRVDSSYQTTTGEGAAYGGLIGSLIGLTLVAAAAHQGGRVPSRRGTSRRGLPAAPHSVRGRAPSTLHGGRTNSVSPMILSSRSGQ